MHWQYIKIFKKAFNTLDHKIVLKKKGNYMRFDILKMILIHFVLDKIHTSFTDTNHEPRNRSAHGSVSISLPHHNKKAHFMLLRSQNKQNPDLE